MCKIWEFVSNGRRARLVRTVEAITVSLWHSGVWECLVSSRTGFETRLGTNFQLSPLILFNDPGSWRRKLFLYQWILGAWSKMACNTQLRVKSINTKNGKTNKMTFSYAIVKFTYTCYSREWKFSFETTSQSKNFVATTPHPNMT